MTEQLAAMSAEVEELNSRIEGSVARGQLMQSTAKNIRSLLAGAPTDLYFKSVKQLADSGEWSELNDRFYQTLAFGTGGLRGRTIGKIVTTTERGNAGEDERPQFPCVGTNAMNFFNINRATRGLVAYLHDWNRHEKISAKPRLVIAHDPRFFSKEFAELAAKVAAENGSVIIKSMLTRLGFNFQVVPEQDRFDGRFPTVRSPNPENAEALTMAINLAQKEDADLVVATDPDCDRMGAAVRAKGGKMKLLTGNQTGSLLAWYRIKTLFDKGVLNKQNASRAVVIKTFVTTDLQKAIANFYGLRCVETLTGFKYIGAKLGKYERTIPEHLRQNYVDLTEQQTRRLRLAHSSFYVFGGEESYGYSGADFVRDKDGNGAVIMFCEVAAYAKSRRQTVDELLDEVFANFGYFAEKNGSLVFEGAEGAAKIARLAESYGTDPFSEVLGSRVVNIKNFESDMIEDIEGDLIPKEKMSIFDLEDGMRIAVRPSGTEPKIKYYLFAQRRPEDGKFDAAELGRIKAQVGEKLNRLWDWLQKDAESRLTASDT